MAEPKPDFKFRTGKYQGMTYKWVCDNHPKYIEWIKENRPEMLKDKITKTINIKETPKEFGKLEVNENFCNEGPEWHCIPYLEKLKKENKVEKEDDEWNF